eukprot:UN30716
MDKTIRVWKLGKPGMLLSTMAEHSDSVEVISYANQRNQIGSCGLQNEVFLWDIKTKIVLSKFGEPQESSYYCCDLNNAGSLLATGDTDNVVKLWNTRISSPKPERLIGHEDCVRSVLIQKDDGHFCLSGSVDGTV